MLILLIITRLRYYYNFIRYHFDRRTLVEIGFILLVLLFLLGRSPADIGYSLTFLFAPDFPHQWVNIWAKSLLFLYIVFEILAFFTMRPTGEWHILGGLPFAKSAMVNYHLLRYAGKTFVLVLLASLPFLIGPTHFLVRLIHFGTALSLLLALQFIAFLRAFTLRNQYRKLLKFFRWLLAEGPLIILLFFISPALQHVLQTFSIYEIITLLFGCILGFTLLLMIWRIYDPSQIESKSVSRPVRTSNLWEIVRKQISALLVNDTIFLLHHKRSLFLIMFIETITLSITCIAYDLAAEAFTSCIVLQIIFSWFFIINMLMILFERDAETQRVIRILPVAPRKLWFARWLLASALICIPMIVPAIMTLVKFSLSLKLFIFIVSGLFGIPAIFATLYCTTGFALFPHAKLAQNIMNLSVLFVILFWFFMPLGSILFLAVALIWANKSRKHFQFSEVT